MKRDTGLALLFVVFIVIFLTATHWQWLMIHLSQQTGTSNSASRAYDFWSGFGSDIGEIALIGGLITVVRSHNCHQRGCWRVGIHLTSRGHKLCKKHIATSPADLDVHDIHPDHL